MIFCKKVDGVFYCREEQAEGSKPVSITGEIVYQALVDNGTEWVHDSDLLSLHVTAKAKADALQKRKEWQEFGLGLLAEIVELNSAKIAAGALTIPQLQAMPTDTTLSAIKDLLILGDLKGAKAAIAAYTGVYYTTEDKTALAYKLAQKIAGA